MRSADLRLVLQHLNIEYEEIGKELRIECPNPNHNDKHPSCTLHFDNKSNKFGWCSCFGCGFHGTIKTLISVVENISIDKAQSYLINFYIKNKGKKIITNYGSIREKESKKKIKIKLPEEFKLIEIGSNSSYEKYLLGRGLTKKEIVKYGWGYCFSGIYRKRVILPVYKKKRLVNFYTRHITTDIEERKAWNAKFSIIAEVIFPYNEIDFNLPYIWITESVFNFFSLRKLKLKNIICIFGNKITDWKVDLMRKFYEIRIVPDGDKGGDELVQSIFLALKKDCLVKSVKMIQGEDANSITTKQTIKQLENVIKTLNIVKRKKSKVKLSYKIDK